MDRCQCKLTVFDHLLVLFKESIFKILAITSSLMRLISVSNRLNFDLVGGLRLVIVAWQLQSAYRLHLLNGLFNISSRLLD